MGLLCCLPQEKLLAFHRIKQFISKMQHQFSSINRVRFFVTPWTAAPQASLSITNSGSLLKLMSMKSVMLPNHIILCRPLPLLPSIFPSIRLFSNESALRIRWPKYWSFSFNISPNSYHQKRQASWPGWGEKWTLAHCWWECKLVQPQ